MEKNTLPDYVVLSKVVESRLNEIEQQLTFANDKLNRLKSEGIPTDLPTLKNIIQSEESFKKWLDDAEKSYIGKIGFLPVEEKRRIHSTFIDLLQRTESDRSGLYGFLFNSQGFIVRQEKDGSLSVDMDEVKERLEEKHRKTFTEKDKQYFSAILKVREAFKELQEFEQKEKYIAFSMTETCNRYILHGITPEAFASSWEWGKMNPKYIEMIKEQEGE